jgi:hypothetical protein
MLTQSCKRCPFHSWFHHGGMVPLLLSLRGLGPIVPLNYFDHELVCSPMSCLRHERQVFFFFPFLLLLMQKFCTNFLFRFSQNFSFHILQKFLTFLFLSLSINIKYLFPNFVLDLFAKLFPLKLCEPDFAKDFVYFCFLLNFVHTFF